MSAIDTLERLHRAGFSVRLNDARDTVLIKPNTIPADLLAQVRADKAEIIDLLSHPEHPESGARFMPWCAPIHPDQFVRWRLNTIEMIEELAELQGWGRDFLDNVLERAINGPVSDLRPNWHYFTGELRQARHEHAMRIQAAEQTKQAANAIFNRRASASSPTNRGYR